MRVKFVWAFVGLIVATTACTALLGDFTVSDQADASTPDATSDHVTLADAPGSTDAGCPNGETACASGCADLQKASANCGVCGHSCNAGMCTSATCGSYVIAKQPTTGTVAKLATDGKRVIWADTGIVAIEQIAATGGSAITLAPSSAANGAIGPELALANGTVAFEYIAASAPSVGVAGVDLADSGAPVFAGTVAIGGISLNRSGTRLVYINTHGTQSDLADCALNGRDAGTCGPGVGGGRFLEQTAADDSYLFFDLTQFNIVPNQAGLYVGSIGTDVVSIFSTDTAQSLTVDGTWAYWTVTNDGGATYAVRRTLEASPGTQLQTPVPSIASSAFATDGVNVYYWTGTAVAERPVAGGAETILSTASAFTEIAVGAGLLVWTDGATISGVVLP